MGGDFEGVVGVAAVSAGVAGDEGEGVGVCGEVEVAEAPIRILKRPAQEVDDFFFGEGFEDIDAAAGKERADDFKGGILCGCADEADGATFDVGEEGVLLGLVEAMDFVDEEDGAGAHLGGLFAGLHDLLDFFDAGEDGGEFEEGGAGGGGDDFGEGGFADAGRSPEDHGGGVVVLDLDAEGFAGGDEVLLTGVFGEGAGAHALGQGRGAGAAGG